MHIETFLLALKSAEVETFSSWVFSERLKPERFLWPILFKVNIWLILVILNSSVSAISEQRMSSPGSKLPLLLYGILLCSSFAPLPVISSKRRSIGTGGPVARDGSWDKREETARDGEYLLGIKRLRRLYCNVGIGFHIQVLPNGKITGVHNENRYSKSFCLSNKCTNVTKTWVSRLGPLGPVVSVWVV